MRNKSIVFLLTFFLSLSFIRSFGTVRAVSPTVTPPMLTVTPVPTIMNGYNTLAGLGCGNAYDTTSNKCCQTGLIQKKLGVGNTGTLVDVIVGAVNSVAESLLQPLFEGMANIGGKSLEPCSSGIPSTPNNLKDPSCICLDTSNLSGSLDKLCKNITNSGEASSCSSCMAGGGVWSGIGCVQANTAEFIQKTLLGTAVGIAGGVALLCIMLAAFQMQTSQGNPEKIKKAQQLLTNCITGLMVVIFSVLILKIIGVDILRIPGFNK